MLVVRDSTGVEAIELTRGEAGESCSSPSSGPLVVLRGSGALADTFLECADMMSTMLASHDAIERSRHVVDGPCRIHSQDYIKLSG